MFTKPNASNQHHRYNNDNYIGNNQINLKFKKALTDLLSFNYYEGTFFGKIKNIFDKDGKSRIYVDQPSLHNKMDIFLMDDSITTAYIVGYTGVGKTTFLRNYFHVYDREPVEREDDIIIYKSFISDEIQNSIEDIVIRYLNYTSHWLIRKYLDNINFAGLIIDLYEYIMDNKGELLSEKPLTQKELERHYEEKNYSQVLDDFSERDPLSYSIMFLKFIISKLNKSKRIILIFDDIERQNTKIQLDFISNVIDKIDLCLKATKTDINVKIIISLRNYLFRARNERQLSALRKDSYVILKNEVPSLSEIVQKRYEVFKDNPSVDTESYKLARKELDVIFNRLYNNYDDVILNLTQKNIYLSLQLFIQMLTNKKYIGRFELYNNGSFVLDSNRYIFKSDDVIKAFAYGEQEIYIPHDNIFVNILSNDNDFIKNELADILSLYVIRYYIPTNDLLYGERYYLTQQTLNTFDYIFSLYKNTVDGKCEKISEYINLIINYLYYNRVLLKSYNDIELESDLLDENKRTCNEESLLYLSPGGKELYDLLKKNALYFYIIRDDINCNVEKNDVLSKDLSEIEKLIYYFHYIVEFSQKEEKLIQAAKEHLDLYQERFGKEIFTSILLESFVQSLTTYFAKATADTQNIRSDLIEFIQNLTRKIDFYNREFFTEFFISDVVMNFYHNNSAFTNYNIESSTTC